MLLTNEITQKTLRAGLALLRGNSPAIDRLVADTTTPATSRHPNP